MKFKFEKNLKIINELITYLHKLESNDIHVTISTEENSSSFLVWGKVRNINDVELYNLKNTLNTKRQHEVEEYYWNLGGECELDGELSLVGMMVDRVDIDYNNNILTLKIYRNDY
jgi:hypothetical protein